MSTPTTAVARYQPVLSDVERITMLGFLAGYRGYTRDAYALDLRQFTAWCWQHEHRLFDVRRVDIECFARDLEDRGKARGRSPAGCARSSGSTATPRRKASSSTRRRCTSAGRASTTSLTSPTWTATSSASSSSPPACRRPRPRPGVAVGAEWAAGLGGDRRQHRSARPRTRASHPDRVAQGPQARHHAAGPARRPSNRPRRRRTPRRADLRRSRPPATRSARGGRIVRRVARRAGITKRVGPHTLRHAFITAALDAGVPLRDVQEAASHADPRTTMRYDRSRQSIDRHATCIVATFVAGAAR